MELRFDCSDNNPSSFAPVTRRQFVQTVGVGAAAVSLPAASLPTVALAKGETKTKPESLVKTLHASLTPEQKKQVAFAWDHVDPRTGGKSPLRLHVSNNWHITKQKVASSFFTKDQQEMIEAIFFGLYDTDWHDRIRKQLRDDAGGYGRQQNIAIFGEPGTGKFEFVMTGRHLTVRCDGDSNDHFSFGGPIFYGHAAQGFNEKADHAGNVFWHQALKANSLLKCSTANSAIRRCCRKHQANGSYISRGKTESSPVWLSPTWRPTRRRLCKMHLACWSSLTGLPTAPRH